MSWTTSRAHIHTHLCVVAGFALAVLLASPLEAAPIGPITFGPADYDNTPNTVTAGPTTQHHNQTFGLFRDVFWWSTRNSAVGIGSPDYINRGNSLVLTGGGPQHAIFGPGPYTALNFTGNSPAAGETYMSIYDTTPGNIAPTNLFDASQGMTVSADVLFAHPGHSVSGGVVAMYNEGQDALALLAHQGGGNNPDHARLDLVFQAAGQGTVLASINLPGLTSFVNAEWYRVTMNLSLAGDGDTWTMNGTIHDHADPTNPNSALAAQITMLNHVGSLSSPGNSLDLTNPGEIGVLAQANQGFGDAIPDPLNPTVDNVGVSITNFQFVPEPSSLALLATGMLGVGLLRRWRKR